MSPNERAGGKRSATASWYHARLIRAARHPVLRAVACTASLVACSAPPAPPPRVAAPVAPTPPPPQYARFAEVMAWPPITSEPFAVQGHLETPRRARTRVSPAARETYAALVTDSTVPSGTIVAMEHVQVDGTTRGQVFLMEKHDDGWHYLELDARGAVLDSVPARCPVCHASAVADHLFGPPRPSPPAPQPVAPRE